MTSSFRIHGFLAGLCLAAGALALPLSAEEITVTVPPDSPPAAAAPSAPSKSTSLPAFTGGGKLSTAQSDTDPTTPATAPPATVKHKVAAKKPAATAKAPPETSDTTTGSTTPAATGAAADKTKTASKASPCKGIDENACSTNKTCKWVEASTDTAGKATKARCRSLAMLKKEATKKTAAKTSESDALPWAKPAGSATGADGAAAATATTDTTAKPKKTKTASVKKVAKPKTDAATAAPAPPADSAPPAASNADPQ